METTRHANNLGEEAVLRHNSAPYSESLRLLNGPVPAGAFRWARVGRRYLTNQWLRHSADPLPSRSLPLCLSLSLSLSSCAPSPLITLKPRWNVQRNLILSVREALSALHQTAPVSAHHSTLLPRSIFELAARDLVAAFSCTPGGQSFRGPMPAGGPGGPRTARFTATFTAFENKRFFFLYDSYDLPSSPVLSVP